VTIEVENCNKKL